MSRRFLAYKLEADQVRIHYNVVSSKEVEYMLLDAGIVAGNSTSTMMPLTLGAWFLINK